MADFDRNSDYNFNTGVVQVKFGFEKPVLEVELNEAQVIQRQRTKELLKAIVQDGILDGGTITYSGGDFTISTATVIVEGEVIYIPNIMTSATDGDIIYLRVWEKEVTADTVMKEYGNEQGTVVTNYLVDDRLGYESSRRIVLAYDLVKDQLGTGTHLRLGTITGGSFVQEFTEIMKVGEVNLDNYMTETEIGEMFIEIV